MCVNCLNFSALWEIIGAPIKQPQQTAVIQGMAPQLVCPEELINCHWGWKVLPITITVFSLWVSGRDLEPESVLSQLHFFSKHSLGRDGSHLHVYLHVTIQGCNYSKACVRGRNFKRLSSMISTTHTLCSSLHLNRKSTISQHICAYAHICLLLYIQIFYIMLYYISCYIFYHSTRLFWKLKSRNLEHSLSEPL